MYADAHLHQGVHEPPRGGSRGLCQRSLSVDAWHGRRKKNHQGQEDCRSPHQASRDLTIEDSTLELTGARGDWHLSAALMHQNKAPMKLLWATGCNWCAETAV